MRVCMRISVCVYLNLYIYINICAHIHVYGGTYIYIYIYMYTYTPITYIYIYICVCVLYHDQSLYLTRNRSFTGSAPGTPRRAVLEDAPLSPVQRNFGGQPRKMLIGAGKTYGGLALLHHFSLGNPN